MVKIKKSRQPRLLANIPKEIKAWIPKKFYLACLEADEISSKKVRRLQCERKRLVGKKYQVENVISIVDRAILKHTTSTPIH